MACAAGSLTKSSSTPEGSSIICFRRSGETCTKRPIIDISVPLSLTHYETLQLVFTHHSHESSGTERGLESRMTLLVSHSESSLLICALRCDVAYQDRKLRDAMAARAAGIENLRHQRVCQAAATIIGQCRDRLDYPGAVEG